MVLFNHLHFAFNDKKKKKEEERKGEVEAKSGPVCNFCFFFSYLSEAFLFHLLSFLIFPLSGKETAFSKYHTLFWSNLTI